MGGPLWFSPGPVRGRLRQGAPTTRCLECIVEEAQRRRCRPPNQRPLKREPRRQKTDAAASRMTEVLGPAWTSPIYGLRTRIRHPIRNRQSPIAFRCPSHRPASVPKDGGWQGMGICARSIPTPPSCTSIRHGGKPPHPRRSGALRTVSAETARSEPTVTSGDPDVCCKLSVSPLPPGA